MIVCSVISIPNWNISFLIIVDASIVTGPWFSRSM